jgi:hypothetical protein
MFAEHARRRLLFLVQKDIGDAKQCDYPDAFNRLAEQVPKIALVTGHEIIAAAADCGAQERRIFLIQIDGKRKADRANFLQFGNNLLETFSPLRPLGENVAAGFFKSEIAGDCGRPFDDQPEQPFDIAARIAGGEKDVRIQKDSHPSDGPAF